MNMSNSSVTDIYRVHSSHYRSFKIDSSSKLRCQTFIHIIAQLTKQASTTYSSPPQPPCYYIPLNDQLFCSRRNRGPGKRSSTTQAALSPRCRPVENYRPRRRRRRVPHFSMYSFLI